MKSILGKRLLTCCLLACVLAALCSPAAAQQPPAPSSSAPPSAAPPAPSRPARDKALSVAFEAKEMAVISAEVPGRVTRIARQMGEDFAKNDLLVELDPAIYKANVLRTASAAQATGKAVAVTNKMRAYQSASSLDEVNAKKEADAATANLEIARKELALTRITAPYPGIVKKVLVREYEWVDKGKPVIEVVNDKVLQANVLMPSTLFGKVKLGQDVSISVVETGTTVSGKVTHVSKVLDPASGTFEVYCEVQNANGAVRSGMTGSLNLGDAR